LIPVRRFGLRQQLAPRERVHDDGDGWVAFFQAVNVVREIDWNLIDADGGVIEEEQPRSQPEAA
jgi:hypothetical protein